MITPFIIDSNKEATMEKWDAYDKYGNILDGFLLRGDVIPQGKLHLVVEIIVKHRDGSFLMMQRSEDKSSYPNYFEISAGGAVLQGETSKEGALRELKEETGIDSWISFTPIHRVISEEGHYIFDNYLVITDVEKDSICYQEGETQSHQWIGLDTLNQYIEQELIVPSQAKRLKELLAQNII